MKDTKKNRSKHSLASVCSAHGWNALIAFAFVAILAGCQADKHPWKGATYQEPQGFGNPISSTYAPMPQILPEVTIDTTQNPDNLSLDQL